MRHKTKLYATSNKNKYERCKIWNIYIEKSKTLEIEENPKYHESIT